MIFCPICGTEFNPYTRGRTKTYCSDNCRDYYKYKQALEKTLLSMTASSHNISLIRGDMFRLANILSSRTKSTRSNKDLHVNN